ncbi:MAG: L-aspartate oxidase [Candidatus Eisenbacteria bacterium]|uniref:L-aspartate oxidase n=1 Tax=Eiseniibacteriota bacterium TaxID=2212470 RepID=A0A538U5T8_UNCEI|nr:MAG: L-aspartate oxidase [Candidatus Eisenbacteria bacterium]
MSETADVLVLGSGLAGLSVALAAARFADVLVLTKKRDSDSNTNYAQGGIAAVFGSQDSFRDHARDTLRCGAGRCDPDVVRQVVREAPERVRELEALGVGFSRSGRGFALGREGGHSRRRIVHAADFTGRAVEQVLLDRVRDHPRVRLIEDRLAVDLILESRLRHRRRGGGRDACWGAYVLDRGTGHVAAVTARCTVLATGGCGKVYLYTSNPDVATGDGVAMAYRAGAPVQDLEFVQFHPTCLYHPRAKSFLLSEALRGEGAVLRTLDGTRFMPRVHRDAELAPRDVVARAIDREMKRRGDPYVTLDLSHLRPAVVRARFPNICAELERFGFDLTRDPIPVVPAAHYMCGGVRATLGGRTPIAGLLAIGETACTGLHGANRLASNSLLEALVGAHHATAEVARRLGEVARAPRAQRWSARGTRPALESVLFDHNWDAVRRIMWDLVGIVRTDARLAVAEARLSLMGAEIEHDFRRLRVTPDLVELRNIALVAQLIVRSARLRRESRGLHYNLDLPRPVRRFAGHSTILRRRKHR